MIKILQVRNIDSFVESRRQKTSEKDKKTVQSILNDVRKNGDSAVKKYERKFNGRNTSQLRVSEKEIKEAKSKISRKEYKAIGALDYWLDFNENWLKMNVKEAIEKMSADSKLNKELLEEDGFPIIEKSLVPIPSVGCYIPGGQARYPSSVVMSVTPAKEAGVKRIVVISHLDLMERLIH